MSDHKKSDLRISANDGNGMVVEIWYDGNYIGRIEPAHGAAIRLTSKYLTQGHGPLIRMLSGDVIEFDVTGKK